MLDFTLDSIKIPALHDYTPPFGTMVTQTQQNHGGLSIQEVNDNIIAPFCKMRGQMVNDDETTSDIEYDGKICITSMQAITINLKNATYPGCKMIIMNRNNDNHTLNCNYVNGAYADTFTILARSTLRIFYDGDKWVNSSAPAVGKLIVQYPTEKAPDIIYPCTAWEEVEDFDGAFFRASGGNADPFIAEGETLIPQSQDTNKNGLSITWDTEIRTGDQTANPTFSATSTHEHKVIITANDGSEQIIADYVFANTHYDYYDLSDSSKYYTDTKTHTISGTVSGDHTHKFTPTGSIHSVNEDTEQEETVPKNFTVKVWRRTA